MMMTTLIKNEFKKLKGTWAGYMPIIAPLLLVGVNVLAFWLRARNVDFWGHYIPSILQLWVLLMLPMYIGIQTALYAMIEHSTNNWKVLLAFPVRRSSIYLAKLLTSVLIVLISYISLFVITIAGAFLVNILRPDYQILSTIPNLGNFGLTLFVAFMATLCIISLHTYLSLRIKSFAASIIIAVVAILPNIIGLTYMPFRFISPWIMPFNSAAQTFLNITTGPSIAYILVFSFILAIGITIWGIIEFDRVDIE